MPGSEESGLLSGSVALNKILCLSLWGLKPCGAWGHSGKVMTPGLWRWHRFRVRLVAAPCFMMAAVSSGSQVSVAGPEHTCASTHAHAHTHTPHHASRAQAQEPALTIKETTKANMQLTSQADAQRDWVWGLHVPGLGLSSWMAAGAWLKHDAAGSAGN